MAFDRQFGVSSTELPSEQGGSSSMSDSNLTTAVNPRQNRGREIAELLKITKTPERWTARSQAGKDRYPNL